MEASEKRAGGGGILSKLGELMFIELVRNYVESLPEDSRGWLGALRDRHVGRGLNLFARAAHQILDTGFAGKGSRPVAILFFAERFTSFVGIPPMQYLQRWRLQMAASRLCEGGASIAVIAAEIGYESEARFQPGFQEK